MPKQKKVRNVNFRQTKSARVADQSYQHFGSFIKKHITRVIRGK